MATVDAIVDEAQLWGFTAISDANMISFLNSVYFRVCARHPWPFLEQAVTSLTVSSGAATVPADCQAVIGIIDTAFDTWLKYETVREYLKRTAEHGTDAATGSSDYYRIEGGLPGGSITIWRSNSDAHKIAYLKQPAALAAAGAESTILLPPEYHDVLVSGLVAKAYLLDENFAAANEMRRIHEADIALMERSLLDKYLEDDDPWRAAAVSRDPATEVRMPDPDSK